MQSSVRNRTKKQYVHQRVPHNTDADVEGAWLLELKAEVHISPQTPVEWTPATLSQLQHVCWLGHALSVVQLVGLNDEMHISPQTPVEWTPATLSQLQHVCWLGHALSVVQLVGLNDEMHISPQTPVECTPASLSQLQHICCVGHSSLEVQFTSLDRVGTRQIMQRNARSNDIFMIVSAQIN